MSLDLYHGKMEYLAWKQERGRIGQEEDMTFEDREMMRLDMAEQRKLNSGHYNYPPMTKIDILKSVLKAILIGVMLFWMYMAAHAHADCIDLKRTQNPSSSIKMVDDSVGGGGGPYGHKIVQHGSNAYPFVQRERYYTACSEALSKHADPDFSISDLLSNCAQASYMDYYIDSVMDFSSDSIAGKAAPDNSKCIKIKEDIMHCLAFVLIGDREINYYPGYLIHSMGRCIKEANYEEECGASYGPMH